MPLPAADAASILERVKGWKVAAAAAAAMIAAACVSSSPRPTAVRTDPELAAVLERARAAHGVPGMGAAIVRGRQISIAVAGRQRVDRAAPLLETDAFHLGSDTKAMTASVVARLVDRRLLRWNETLAEALPDIAAG